MIRFNTQDGRIVETVADEIKVAYEVAMQVPIVYQPSKPEQAILDPAMGTWLNLLCLGVGVVAVFLAGLIGLGLVPVGE